MNALAVVRDFQKELEAQKLRPSPAAVRRAIKRYCKAMKRAIEVAEASVDVDHEVAAMVLLQARRRVVRDAAMVLGAAVGYEKR